MVKEPSLASLPTIFPVLSFNVTFTLHFVFLFATGGIFQSYVSGLPIRGGEMDFQVTPPSIVYVRLTLSTGFFVLWVCH